MPKGIPKNGINKGWRKKGVIYKGTFVVGHIGWNAGFKGKGICKASSGSFKKGHKSYAKSGKEHYNWIKDRSILQKNKKNDPEYLQWVKRIKKRDNKKCLINNKDCCGRLEVHHILGWAEHPELRYNDNNGITVCKFHHPKKKDEVIKSIPFFQSLIVQKPCSNVIVDNIR